MFLFVINQTETALSRIAFIRPLIAISKLFSNHKSVEQCWIGKAALISREKNKQNEWNGMKSINEPISAFLIRIKSLRCLEFHDFFLVFFVVLRNKE